MGNGILKVAVPPGIGDSLWSMVKVQSIMKNGGYNSCEVFLQETDIPRGKDFIAAFDFVSKAHYGKFNIHAQDAFISANAVSKLNELFPSNSNDIYQPSQFIDKTGEYIYIESHQNYLNKFDWLLIANGHLERGNRLETWLPQFNTNFNIGNNFVFSDFELSQSDYIYKEVVGEHPFVVFYLGPLRGNTTDGHNRNSLWSLLDWFDTAGKMLDANKDLKIVLIGAKYDADYTMRFLMDYVGYDYLNKFVNLVGMTPIGLTYALIKKSKFVLSYQSGIGIFSVYLGVPTACFWRPYGNSISPQYFLSFQEEMASAWAPKWSLGEDGNYLPLIYTKCTPSSIVDNVKKWIV